MTHRRDVGDNRKTSVGKDDTLKVGKNLIIDAGDQIVIKTGQASITMKKDGTIIIKGKAITIDAMQKIEEKAMNITSEAQTKSCNQGRHGQRGSLRDQYDQGEPGEDQLSWCRGHRYGH